MMHTLKAVAYKNWLICSIALIPPGTGCKLNVHKTFRRHPGRLLNLLCTFNLRPVSRGFWWQISVLKKILFLICEKNLTLSWRRSLSYRNQSTDLQSKSMNWFLYDKDLRHERVKIILAFNQYHAIHLFLYPWKH